MESVKKEMACKASNHVSIAEAFIVQLICSLGLALAFWIARNVYSISSHLGSFSVLLLYFGRFSVVECPIVILLYSRYRTDREQCSYLKAVARGILGLLAGAIIHAYGAIVLGAPIGVQPNGTIDYMICIPALGAMIGAWFGAWPMPLDWEKSIQEKWPICLGYVAALGYLIYSIAMVAYLAFSHMRSGLQHVKRD